MNFLLFILLVILLPVTAIAKPQRVVSLCLPTDEIIWQLVNGTPASSQIMSYSALVKNPNYSNIADETLTVIPAVAASNMEVIARNKPDLIFLSEFNRPAFLQQLKKFAILTEKIPEQKTLDHVLALISKIGKILNIANTDTFTNQLLTRLNQLREYSPKQQKRVLIFGHDHVVAGRQTLINDVLLAASVKNVAADAGISGWQRLSPEKIKSLEPELLIIGEFPRQTRQEQITRIKQTSGWAQLNAVKQNAFIWIPNKLLAASSGFSVNAAEEIFAKVYR